MAKFVLGRIEEKVESFQPLQTFEEACELKRFFKRIKGNFNEVFFGSNGVLPMFKFTTKSKIFDPHFLSLFSTFWTSHNTIQKKNFGVRQSGSRFSVFAFRFSVFCDERNSSPERCTDFVLVSKCREF
jgi:hypothetical protein